MTSTNNIRTKDDFKNVFGRSPIKPGEPLILDNDDLDDEETQISNQIRKEENQAFYNNVATNARRSLYHDLLVKPELGDKLQDIPLNSLTKQYIKPSTKPSTKHNHGGRKQTRIFRKKSTKRRLHKSSRRNSRKYK